MYKIIFNNINILIPKDHKEIIIGEKLIFLYENNPVLEIDFK